MISIAIDLNVRVRDGLTYSGFEDVYGGRPSEGPVQVVETESGLVGRGWIVEVDEAAQLVYLRVDWPSLRETSPFVIATGENAAAPHAGVQRHVPVATTVVRRSPQPGVLV